MSTLIQKIMNAVIVTGEYIDKQGQKKKSYLTIGKLFIYAGGGMSLKLDAFPANNQSISFYNIEPKKKKQPQPNNNYGGNQQQPQPQPNNNYGGNQQQQQPQPNNNYGGNQQQQYNQYGR